MSFRYPRLSNWILFQPLGNGQCRLFHGLAKTTFIMDERTAWYIQRLDGSTDPYRVSASFSSEEVSCILRFLDENDLLRYGRFLFGGISCLLYSMCFPKATEHVRKIARIFNSLLLLSFLPVLVAGVLMLFSNLTYVETSLPGVVWGTLTGMLLHEVGHSFACLSYGGFVYEGGVGIMSMLPCAYVFLENRFIQNRLHKTQIHAAGIEVNFFLAGCYSGIASVLPDPSFFFAAAFVNFAMGCFNLLLIDGLDGMNILSELIGVDSFVDKAKNAVLNPEKRAELLRCGRQGKVILWLSIVASVLQVALPVLLVYQAGAILSWFV